MSFPKIKPRYLCGSLFVLIAVASMILGIACLQVNYELNSFFCVYYFLPVYHHSYFFPFLRNLGPFPWAVASTAINFGIGFLFGLGIEKLIEITPKKKRK